MEDFGRDLIQTLLFGYDSLARETIDAYENPKHPFEQGLSDKYSFRI